MPEVVKAIMRSEILDAATCDICAQLDGIILPADDPAWQGEMGQPAHCNCRYMLVPILEGIEPVLDYTPKGDIKKVIQRLGGLDLRGLLDQRKIPTKGIRRFTTQELTLDDIKDILEPADLILRLYGFE